MKNVVELVRKTPVFRVRLPGAPPPRGWAIKHISGMEPLDVKPGYWMSEWHYDGGEATFNFEPNLTNAIVFEKAEAEAISAALHANAEIETEVVKLG